MSKFERMLQFANRAAEAAQMHAERRIEEALKLQATKMLMVFEEMLAEHKLHNHEIRIKHQTGLVFMTIDGLMLQEFDAAWPNDGKRYRNLPILATLKWIDDQIDGETDEQPWAKYLPDNALLNERNDHGPS